MLVPRNTPTRPATQALDRRAAPRRRSRPASARAAPGGYCGNRSAAAPAAGARRRRRRPRRCRSAARRSRNGTAPRPLCAASSAASVAARPRPRQLVAVKWVSCNGVIGARAVHTAARWQMVFRHCIDNTWLSKPHSSSSERHSRQAAAVQPHPAVPARQHNRLVPALAGSKAQARPRHRRRAAAARPPGASVACTRAAAPGAPRPRYSAAHPASPPHRRRQSRPHGCRPG